MGEVSLSCQCGALRGTLTEKTLKSGTHLTCHCKDCRAFQVAVGRDDPGAIDGVRIVQIGPGGMAITQGVEHLAALRLSPRGPLRFYAACCGTPIATTPSKLSIPFAGLLADMVEHQDALGRVRAQVNITQPDGKVTHKRMGRVVMALFSNAGAAILKGERKKTPFFDAETGRPVVDPVVIDKVRKAEIYARL
ncbi:DUF6151 family protein [Gymnodinialimonas hymeniacidonis]|uniref:DUF6151 family protein n=1 Tax=Gymnodinialimonas hymeniacidonis TaxID=3126508 RepID=UPI0034C604FC